MNMSNTDQYEEELEKMEKKYKFELESLINSYYFGYNLVRISPFILVGLLIIIGCCALGTIGLALLGILIVAVPVYLVNNVKMSSDKPLTAQIAYRVCVIMNALISISNYDFVDEQSLPKVNSYGNTYTYNQFVKLFPEYKSEKLERLSKLDIPDGCYGWRDTK